MDGNNKAAGAAKGKGPLAPAPESRGSRQLWIYEGKRTLACLAGSFLYALGINLFIVPAGFYSGGILGICQVIRTLLVEGLRLPLGGFDIAGVLYYLANLPIFVLAYKKMGKRFFAKTLVCVTSMSLLLAVLPVHTVLEEALPSCIFGGILSGAGVGLILRMGGSSGGMDIVGVILTKWKQDYSVGKVNLMVNVVLYAACLLLFDVETALYSVIYAAVYALAVDRLHVQNINVEVNIITKVGSEVMEKEIFEEMNRGITKWQALGAYTYEQCHVLYILISKYEVHQLKSIVHKYDPHAFIVVNEGVSVDGHFLKKL